MNRSPATPAAGRWKALDVAGAMTAGFAVASHIGGLADDRFGRRPIMLVWFAGSALGFGAIALISRALPLRAAMACCFFIGEASSAPPVAAEEVAAEPPAAIGALRSEAPRGGVS